MLIVAIETSGRAGSAALLDPPSVLEERRIDPAAGTARMLAPSIEALFRDRQLAPAACQLVAVSVGPGSFTGLRIGVTTAKALAYAIGCPVLGVDTLDVIAAQAEGDSAGAERDVRELHVVIDAQRRELFLARYVRSAERGESRWQRIGDTELVAADDWLSKLPARTLVSGPALARLRPRIPAAVEVVGQENWEPTAVAVGTLAARQWQSGRRDDLWSLAPRYIRPSYAEEKQVLGGG